MPETFINDSGRAPFDRQSSSLDSFFFRRQSSGSFHLELARIRKALRFPAQDLLAM